MTTRFKLDGCAAKGCPAFVLCALALALALNTAGVEAKELRTPNVVVIMADDVALMDFGIYGGEARTTNIDRLAERGALFTQFRASPLCSPSRAMLLTGMDAHLTGVATIPEVLPSEHEGHAGYSMALEPGVLTIADRLRSSGYRTLMSGKWHMGSAAEEMPQAHGFDRSFALAASGADNWADKPYMPFYSEAPWFEDGVEASLPEDFYSSRFHVNKLIAYLDTTDRSKPFFAYLPFQAIHIPVQAPAEFVAHYKGRYDAGWDALRKSRHRRAQELGLVPEGVPMADLPPDYRPWDQLSTQEQDLYASRMEVNAAMLEAMDFHIGRLIDFLKAQGEYRNTVFVVLSDNGPEPTRGDTNVILSAWQALNGYSTASDPHGGPGYWGFIGPEWAAAAATPGAWFKFYATEGGLRAPLIIAGPGIGQSKITSPAMIQDIAPTLLDLLGIELVIGEAKPITGRSLLPVLKGERASAYGINDVRAIEVSGNSALYKGEYKITRGMPPVGDGQWRLFNIVRDPGETVDVSASEPGIKADLIKEFRAYSQRVGVLAMPEGYDSEAQVASNAIAQMLHNYPWLYAILTLLGVITLAALGITVRLLRKVLLIKS